VKKYSLAITLLLLLGSCSALEKLSSVVPQPKFSYESMKIQRITLSDIQLRLVTSVQNPYSTSIPQSKLGADLLIEGNKLTHIDTDLGVIEGKSTKSLPIDIKIKYTDLIKFYKKFPTKEILNLELNGDLKLPIPTQYQLAGKSEISFPFQVSRPIPSVQPSVEINNFSVKLPNLKELATGTASSLLGSALGIKKESPTIETYFDLEFANGNAAKMLLNTLSFDMELEGNQFLSLSPKEITQVGNSNLVKVTTLIPVIDAGSSLIKILQQKTANYSLKGISAVSFPGMDSTPVDFNYDKLGKLKLK
jgi:LEA14-like dessication related protein